MLNDTLNSRNMIILLIYLKKLGDRYHRCKCFPSHYGDEKYSYILLYLIVHVYNNIECICYLVLHKQVIIYPLLLQIHLMVYYY